MIHVGVDYSMTSPAICIHDGETWHINNCKIHYLTNTKKFEGNFGFCIGHAYPIYKDPEERFDIISSWVFSILWKHCPLQTQLNTPMFVTIEGYSMGSRGRVFHIAENTGLLKHKLWKHHIPFDTPAPTSVKKFATGKGNANKERMHECFVAETSINPSEVLNSKVDGNPVSDVVDAYFMCKYGFDQNNPK